MNGLFYALWCMNSNMDDGWKVMADSVEMKRNDLFGKGMGKGEIIRKKTTVEEFE